MGLPLHGSKWTVSLFVFACVHLILVLTVASSLEDKNFSEVHHKGALYADGDQVIDRSTWESKGLSDVATVFPTENKTATMEWSIDDPVTPPVDDPVPPVEGYQAPILFMFFLVIGTSLEGHVKSLQCFPV